MKFSWKSFEIEAFLNKPSNPFTMQSHLKVLKKIVCEHNEALFAKKLIPFLIEWLYRMHSSVIFDGFDSFFRDSFFCMLFELGPPPPKL